MKRIGTPKHKREDMQKLAAKHLNANANWVSFYPYCGREEDNEYSLKMIVRGNIIDRYVIQFKDGKYTLFDMY